MKHLHKSSTNSCSQTVALLQRPRYARPMSELDRQAIQRTRLPGGARTGEVADVLGTSDAAGAAVLQSQLSEEDWGLYTAAADAAASVPGPPVCVYAQEIAERPDVVARFVAYLTVAVRPSIAKGWIVSGYIVLSGGELVIGQLTLEPELNTGTGITRSLLHGVSVSQILARAQAMLVQTPEWLELVKRLGLGEPPHADKERAHRAAATAATAGTARRRGRKGWGEEHYRRVALEYLALQREGVGRGILNRLAEREAKRLKKPIARETMRDWVRRARELGFLAGGVRGRAGARPGPNLYPKKEES